VTFGQGRTRSYTAWTITILMSLQIIRPSDRASTNVTNLLMLGPLLFARVPDLDMTSQLLSTGEAVGSSDSEVGTTNRSDVMSHMSPKFGVEILG